MHTLLATEIWGRTPYVEALAQLLLPFAGHVTIVDPYAGTDPGFQNEDEAYAAYLEQCGHREYGRRVQQILHRAREPIFLVGFSAGAAAVWSAICTRDTANAKYAACFYGSGIRTMADQIPRVPVDLVFPEHEPHFDVAALASLLSQMPLAQCHMVPEEHGFMNPQSAGYDEAAARHWTAWLKRRIAAAS